MPPVARLGDKCVGPSGKSGVITTASDFYFVEDKDAARIGDTVTYSDGSTTIIAEGDPGLEVIGRGVARVGYRLADGGKIVEGATKVFSDDPYPGAGTAAEATMVAARSSGSPFVAPACAFQGIPPDDVDDNAHHAPSAAHVLLDRDLDDGGRHELHVDPATTTESASSGAAR